MGLRRYVKLSQEELEFLTGSRDMEASTGALQGVWPEHAPCDYGEGWLFCHRLGTLLGTSPDLQSTPSMPPGRGCILRAECCIRC